jgi:hypothetical protein
MGEKRKTVKGTAQKIGNPPKHPQFGEGTAVNSKGRPRASKNLSIYLVKAARDQVFATAGCRTISELQATAMSSLWL